MTAVVTDFTANTVIDPDQVERYGKALVGMGAGDDDAAKLVMPISLGLPFPIMSSIGSVQAKAVGASTAYVVASGKLFYVVSFSTAGGAILQLTPSGGSVFSTSSTQIVYGAPIGLCLGAGDTITTSAAQYVYGYLLDLPTYPSSPTRVLQEITNVTTYTVASGKRLLLTHAYPSTAGSQTILTIDGVNAFSATALGGVTASPMNIWRPVLLTAGQALAVSTAANYTISGLLYTV